MDKRNTLATFWRIDGSPAGTRSSSASSPLFLQFVLVLLFLAWGLMPEQALPGPALRVRETLRRDQMNEADYERMERGYYEHILDAGRQLGAPVGQAGGSPVHTVAIVPFDAGPLTFTVDDLREYILRPNLSVVRGHGITWSTNSLGMRDRGYTTVKPPHTVRIALVGDSIGAGWGVNDEEGFEPVLEDRLGTRAQAAGGPAVEILNFAVPGYAPGQRWENFRRNGWALQPDLVLYEATLADPGWDERRLRGLLPRSVGWDEPMYHDALVRAGARPGGTMDGYKEVLRHARWDLLAGVYRTIAAECQRRSVPSVWVLIPRVGKATDPVERNRLMTLAERSGFSVVIDLSDTFDGIPAEDLAIDPADYHPNASGHARLARRLEAALTSHAELCRIWSAPAHGGSLP